MFENITYQFDLLGYNDSDPQATAKSDLLYHQLFSDKFVLSAQFDAEMKRLISFSRAVNFHGNIAILKLMRLEASIRLQRD